VDEKAGLAGIIATQVLPFFNAESAKVVKEFKTLVSSHAARS
jgi:hypothetical protein